MAQQQKKAAKTRREPEPESSGVDDRKALTIRLDNPVFELMLKMQYEMAAKEGRRVTSNKFIERMIVERAKTLKLVPRNWGG